MNSKIWQPWLQLLNPPRLMVDMAAWQHKQSFSSLISEILALENVNVGAFSSISTL